MTAAAVGSAEPQGVVEVPVDALGVVATGVESVEVRVVSRDRAQVLGSVELTLGINGVAVQADGDGAAAVVVGESVPAVPAARAGESPDGEPDVARRHCAHRADGLVNGLSGGAYLAYRLRSARTEGVPPWPVDHS